MSTSDSKILRHECRGCGYISNEFPCPQCGSVRITIVGSSEKPYTTIADYPDLYPTELEGTKCEQCGAIYDEEPCPLCSREAWVAEDEYFDQAFEEPANDYNPYWILKDTLARAYDQAKNGKGKERHAKKNEPFEKQKICEITRRVGLGYPLGQAIKKAEEALRLDTQAGVKEILGAINYLAAAIIVMEEGEE